MRRGVMAGTKLGARHSRDVGSLGQGAAGELRAHAKTGGPKLADGLDMRHFPLQFPSFLIDTRWN